jgi:prepilin-type N-terminal cleavage/methylation domain-containing protein
VKPSNKFSTRAFTLLETLVALLVLGILSGLVFVGVQAYLAKAASTTCLSNLKNLGATFQLYLTDHENRWPPHPKNQDPYSQEFENHWLNLFQAKYQIPPKTWICPVLRKANLKAPDGRVLKLHYVPSLFDATKGRAMELNTDGKKHPWLMEIADAHGDGALMYFPDGGVVSMNQFLRDRGISTD